MKYIIICLIILLVVVPVEARTVELTLHPPKSLKPEQKYQLLVKADEQSDADAGPLYEKAVQSLPGGLKMDEIDQWLKTPPDKLPKKQVQSVLEQLKPAFKLIEQAAKCKQCDWPYLDDDTLSQTLANYRKLLFLFALQVRLQISQGSYDEAISTIQTGFAMARHFGEDPILVRGLVGIGMAAYMCRQIEEFVQRPDVPNLYQALRDLPHPFIDLTRQAEWEEPDIKGKVHLLMNRLDRHVAALQCIEAICLYAGSHDGTFPGKLLDVKEVHIPADPVTTKPFSYNLSGSTAILETPGGEDLEGKYAIRYELHLEQG
jgi:hypothetical protein